VEDEAVRVSSKLGKLLVLSAEATESAKRDYIRLVELYSNNDHKVKLVHSAWQDLEVANMNLGKKSLKGLGKLIWLDPHYGDLYQPKLTEQGLMRKLLDDLSTSGTVVLIFGRAIPLVLYWVPIFAARLNGSKVDWHVEATTFVIVRSQRRDRHTNNFRVWHSQTELVLTVVRKTPETKKQKSVIPSTRRYSDAFVKKYGKENGLPTNVFKDYLPPSSRCRLRDLDGNELRANAEKSILINEFFVDLFTQEDDLVIDLFAGSASMALACIKRNRNYYGSDVDAAIRPHAIQRIAKSLNAKERGLMELEMPGLPRALAEQVCL
jgi:hypothetical protein